MTSLVNTSFSNNPLYFGRGCITKKKCNKYTLHKPHNEEKERYLEKAIVSVSRVESRDFFFRVSRGKEKGRNASYMKEMPNSNKV